MECWHVHVTTIAARSVRVVLRNCVCGDGVVWRVGDRLVGG
jgi:hypothetical protein